jgi:hypothetical protein
MRDSEEAGCDRCGKYVCPVDCKHHDDLISPGLAPEFSNEKAKQAIDPTLKELRDCQEKIRKMRNELRCITEAHQRLLFAHTDLAKQNVAYKDRSDRWQAAYDKAAGNEPNWLRRTMRDVGMILLRLAQ